MKEKYLKQIFKKAQKKSILVIGDYFLDKILLLDRNKDKKSLETGLTAYQTVDKRISPGAAGTVTDNLSALKVGQITALGYLGRDGEGFELIQGLKEIGVQTDYLIETEKRVTPTYIKPMIIKEDKEEEINRLDIRNWSKTPEFLEEEIIIKLKELSAEVDAIIVLDQVEQENHGVITTRIRKILSQIGKQNKDLIIYADSRHKINKFKNIIIKCNHYEAVEAVYPDFTGEPEADKIKNAGLKLTEKSGKPVFITWGEKGQLIFNNDKVKKVPGINVEGPIDICGAGDAATSGIVTALCGGASLKEAALVGNLTASITIKQLGTTGTASPEEVLERFRDINADI